MSQLPMPYFDEIFTRLAKEPTSALVQVLGTRHVHWGYWPDPARADGTIADLVRAAEALARRVTDAGAIAAGQRVLDVGCGFGGTIASLNERYAPIRLTGLNIDHRQLARARELVCAAPRNDVEFVHGDACRMPFASASVDRVLALECIFHFPSRLRFLREARRVLKPGGRMALCDFAPYGPALGRLVPYIARHGAAMRRFYGTFNLLGLTKTYYVALARLAGFRLLGDEDITENTLPTYPVLLDFMRADQCHQAVEATSHMQHIASEGWARYRIMAFELSK